MSRPTTWMITCLATGEVFEIFDRANARKPMESPFVKVETAMEYLGRINRDIREMEQTK